MMSTAAPIVNTVPVNQPINQPTTTTQSKASNNTNSLPPVNISPSACALYIGDLKEDITEAQIFQFISQIRISPTSCRVCRDNVTKKSLRYGYINFQSKEDADIAMKELNYRPLCGQAVRMMPCQRDPSLRKSGKGNIIIKNLNKAIQPRVLFDIIRKIGNVVSLSLKPDKLDENKQNAYIQFEKTECAELACKALHGTELSGYTVTVAPFIPQKEKFEKRDMKDETFVNCYVKNLPKGKFDTEEKLAEYFSKFGQISSSKLVYDNNYQPTGAAYVCFNRHEDAMNAINKCDGAELGEEGEKPMHMTRFQKRTERIQVLKEKYEHMKIDKRVNNNVYIKNLHGTVTDESLEKEFSKIGPIVSAKVMTHENLQSRGFGFVSFQDPNDAIKCIEQKNGQIFYGKTLHCELAQRKSERQQSLRNQFRMSQHYILSSPTMPYAMMKQPAGAAFLAPNNFINPVGNYMSGAASAHHHQNRMPPYSNSHHHRGGYNQNYGGNKSHNFLNNYGNNNPNNSNNVGEKGDSGYNKMNSVVDQGYNHAKVRSHQQHQSQNQQQQQQQQQNNFQPKSASMTNQEKSNYGHVFLEQIKKMKVPELSDNAPKIIGMFLDAGADLCQKMSDNPAYFRQQCEKALGLLKESAH